MSTIELTAEEVTDSINGYDEIAIKRAFGTDLYTLREEPMSFLRALIFIVERRTGKKDPQAYEAAMSLVLSGVHGYFAETPEDFDPEEPDSEAGKDA
jgi:hypothetical protein